jgi:hypothetical protein
MRLAQMSAAIGLSHRHLFDRVPWSNALFWPLLAAAILLLDYVTGPLISFPILFVLPVALVAWHRDAVLASAYVLALCSVHYAFHFLWGSQWNMTMKAIDTLLDAGMLVLLAVLVAHIERQSQRVKTLEGILPICLQCKSIRDDRGEWLQLEAYLSERSAAHFSHGLCPACLANQYQAMLSTENSGR